MNFRKSEGSLKRGMARLDGLKILIFGNKMLEHSYLMDFHKMLYTDSRSWTTVSHLSPHKQACKVHMSHSSPPYVRLITI